MKLENAVAALLKDIYDEAFIARLGAAVNTRCAGFSARAFARAVFDANWAGRELKERMRHISVCLHAGLGLPFPEAVAVLMDVAPGFSSLAAMVFPDFVEAYGQEHWDESMPALACFTRYSSSEFAVRPFYLRDTTRMLEQMRAWSRDDNEHLRRLASEGSRPRLPWAIALPAFKRDPAPLLPLLDQLRADPSAYVRRSVANNLNDIAKDNPDVTLQWARRWLGSNPHTDWIIKHGCRTLLKRANPEALALFSYAGAAHVAVESLKLESTTVCIGDDLYFEVRLGGRPSLGRLRIEYGIDYVKSNGRHARKIFKLAEGCFDEAARAFGKRHSLRQMTTRRHYAGRHRLAIIVNGEVLEERVFNLMESSS